MTSVLSLLFALQLKKPATQKYQKLRKKKKFPIKTFSLSQRTKKRGSLETKKNHVDNNHFTLAKPPKNL